MTSFTGSSSMHGGWAYKLGDVFSETFPSRDRAAVAAKRVADLQRIPGDTEVIEWEDASGIWHEETESGSDRPEAFVEDGLPARVAASKPAQVTSNPFLLQVLLAGVVGAILAIAFHGRHRRK